MEAAINNNISADNFKIKKNNLITTRNGYKGYKESQYQLASALSNYKSDSWQIEDIDNATKKAAERISDYILGNKLYS